MWLGFLKAPHNDKCQCPSCIAARKDDMSSADLDNGGRLQPEQGPVFKRKKPPIPKED